MRYLSLLTATAVPGGPPPAELMAAIMTLGQEAVTSGVLVDQAGLVPGSRSEIVVEASDLTVLDGPFTETKELLSYAVYEVRSKAEAVEWTSRFMGLHRDLWPGWSGTATVVQVMGGGGAPPA